MKIILRYTIKTFHNEAQHFNASYFNSLFSETDILPLLGPKFSAFNLRLQSFSLDQRKMAQKYFKSFSCEMRCSLNANTNLQSTCALVWSNHALLTWEKFKFLSWCLYLYSFLFLHCIWHALWYGVTADVSLPPEQILFFWALSSMLSVWYH